MTPAAAECFSVDVKKERPISVPRCKTAYRSETGNRLWNAQRERMWGRITETYCGRLVLMLTEDDWSAACAFREEAETLECVRYWWLRAFVCVFSCVWGASGSGSRLMCLYFLCVWFRDFAFEWFSLSHRVPAPSKQRSSWFCPLILFNYKHTGWDKGSF